MATTLTVIRNRLRELAPGLRARHGVESLQIIGSFARNEATDASDLDLVVRFSGESIGLFRYASLVLEMEDALGIAVDLVDVRAIRPEIEASLLRDAVPVGCARPSAKGPALSIRLDPPRV